MKLNLLPTTVGKEKQVRNAVIGAALIALACILLAVGMIVVSRENLAHQQQLATDLRPHADQVVAINQDADRVLLEAQPIFLNVGLAQEMNRHNSRYPDLYDDVFPFIPAFFRATQMVAVPVAPEQSTLTMQGVIQTYQQYADMMIAMLRIPGATSVGRAGFQHQTMTVPALTADDQTGTPRIQGEQAPPTDPMARLDWMIARARDEQGFLNVGGFGTGQLGITPGQPRETVVRGAMPGWSAVVFTVNLQRDLRTPDPRATLMQHATFPAPTGVPTTTPAGLTPPGR
jgi:hypothetical protein